MNAPHLTRKLVLEAPQKLPDGAGGFSTTWTAQGTLWAEVTARTGNETLDSGSASVSRVGYRIVVRAAPSGAPSRPVPDQRFREGARVFRIQAVSEADPRGAFLVCWAEETAA